MSPSFVCYSPQVSSHCSSYLAKKMKTTIIFLCFLGVCDAIVNNGTLNQTDNNVPSSSLTTYSTAIVSSAHATPDHQTNRPTVSCPPCSLVTTPEYNKLLLIAGGLILACTILLISTLLLAWKVCQLSRRLKMLSGHSDLMIPAKFSMGNNKSDADAKETTVLMSNLNQTRDEDGEGGNGPEMESKEEKEMCENGVEQKEKDAKNEEVKETAGAAAEESSPKEEGKKSQVDKSKSGPTSGEAKDSE